MSSPRETRALLDAADVLAAGLMWRHLVKDHGLSGDEAAARVGVGSATELGDAYIAVALELRGDL